MARGFGQGFSRHAFQTAGIRGFGQGFSRNSFQVEEPNPVETDQGQGQSFVTGGGYEAKRKRIIAIVERMEQAADSAAKGNFTEAQRKAIEAAQQAAQEIENAQRDDALALEAIERDILAAGERLRAADLNNRLDRIGVMIAYRTALQSAYAMQQQMLAETEEMAVLTMLLLH